MIDVLESKVGHLPMELVSEAPIAVDLAKHDDSFEQYLVGGKSHGLECDT
jgi:hypothetical protein